MNSRNSLIGLTLCAAALTAAGRAEAWSVPVGDYIGQCTVSYLAGGQTLFTLNTQGFYNRDKGLYTYDYNLTNVSDPYGLTSFAVNVGSNPVQDYFSGFGPQNGIALHDGNLVPVGQTFTAGTDSANLHTANASVSDAGGYVTFTDLTTPIAVGQSNGSQLTTNFSYSKNDKPGEELFLQSTAFLAGATVNVHDGAGNAFSVTTCGEDVCGPALQGPHDLPAAPEPGSVLPFALGGLGLLGLTLRARRRAA